VSIELSDFERGEYDCVQGNEARDCEAADYYSGFAQQYAKDQGESAHSLERLREAGE
jgi:hypothetical protein